MLCSKRRKILFKIVSCSLFDNVKKVEHKKRQKSIKRIKNKNVKTKHYGKYESIGVPGLWILEKLKK